MPRLKAIKPICPTCGHARYVACYLGHWECQGVHPDDIPADFMRGEDGYARFMAWEAGKG